VTFVAGGRKSDSVIAPDIAPRPGLPPAKPSGEHIALGGFVLFRRPRPMIADRHAFDQSRNLQPAPAWAEVWHIWTVIIPRRSITGKLVYGKVWRRCDGRHWIYKKFIEYDE
jgi:hypothetical protein